MATERMQQIDALIKREIAVQLQGNFPDDFITVTQVHVTKDLEHAKVWVASPIDPQKAVTKCKSIAPELRRYLASKIVARKVPQIHFALDDTYEKAEKIDRLIEEIKKN